MLENGPEEKVEPTKEQILSALGGFSFLGLYVLTVVLTLIGRAPYGQILKNVFWLVTGRVAEIPANGQGLLGSSLEVMVMVAVTLPLAFLFGQLGGKSESYNMEAIQKMLDKGPSAMFAVVVVEEVITRGFFLGLLGGISESHIWFYAMFMVGNALWACIHLFNFMDKDERELIRILPQFIGGIVFTYAFVRFGIWGSIMTHMIYNVVLSSSLKEKMPRLEELGTVVYYAVLLLSAGLLMHHRGLNPWGLEPWLRGQMVPLEGFEFWDYALILISVDAFIGAVATILLLDTQDFDREAFEKLNELKSWGFVFGLFVAGLVSAALNLGFIKLASWLLPNASALVIALTVTLQKTLMTKTSSGSSLARAFTANLLTTYLFVAAVYVLNLWSVVGLILLMMITGYLPMFWQAE